jgi:hypothetical protein
MSLQYRIGGGRNPNTSKVELFRQFILSVTPIKYNVILEYFLMNQKINFILPFLLIVFCAISVFAQESVTVVTPTTEAGEDLDLHAVVELLQDSENLEEFEKALNDSANEINNLDLDEDGQVDFIRVLEYSQENTHVIVLQVPLGENEYQDVATIEIQEGETDEDWVLQAVGAEDIYGEDYIVEPEPQSTTTTTVVYVHAWPVVRVMFLPGYRLWVSPFRWGVWPPWWRPWRPLARSVYRSRTIRWHRHAYRHTRVRQASRAPSIYGPHKKSSPKATHKKKQTVQKQQKKQTTQKKTTQQKKQTQKKKQTTKKKKP